MYSVFSDFGVLSNAKPRDTGFHLWWDLIFFTFWGEQTHQQKLPAKSCQLLRAQERTLVDAMFETIAEILKPGNETGRKPAGCMAWDIYATPSCQSVSTPLHRVWIPMASSGWRVIEMEGFCEDPCESDLADTICPRIWKAPQEKPGTLVLRLQTAWRDDRIRRRSKRLPDSARTCLRTSAGTLRLHPHGESIRHWGSGERSPSEPRSAPNELAPCLARASSPGQPCGCRNSRDTRLPWAE
jgi:hypothetical protein